MATTITSNFPPDLIITSNRATNSCIFTDRLTSQYLTSTSTAAETTAGVNSVNSPSFLNNISYMTGASGSTTGNFVGWAFKRASGFFDIVCYTGTGVATTVAHNLGVVPELIIVKARNRSGFYVTGWCVWNTSVVSTYGPSYLLSMNETSPAQANSAIFTTTQPTSTVFSVGTSDSTNASANGNLYVSYLFATLAGISKVGSYTGNGTSQTIACGFTTGARFIMIKRTNSAGDWYIWDSARGIVSANDPHLSLNTTVAEVTTDDSVDPNNSGFIVNQAAATNINVTSATYIFLAIA